MLHKTGPGGTYHKKEVNFRRILPAVDRSCQILKLSYATVHVEKTSVSDEKFLRGGTFIKSREISDFFFQRGYSLIG